MRIPRRSFGWLLLGAGALVLAAPVVAKGTRLFAAAAGQEQAPNRREFTIVAQNYEFAPKRLEVAQDDLVKITLTSRDEAHSFVIDGYRIMKRVPAGGTTTFEFRADRAGTFPFYCGMTSSPGHERMRGELVVAAR